MFLLSIELGRWYQDQGMLVFSQFEVLLKTSYFGVQYISVYYSNRPEKFRKSELVFFFQPSKRMLILLAFKYHPWPPTRHPVPLRLRVPLSEALHQLWRALVAGSGQ